MKNEKKKQDGASVPNDMLHIKFVSVCLSVVKETVPQDLFPFYFFTNHFLYRLTWFAGLKTLLLAISCHRPFTEQQASTVSQARAHVNGQQIYL